MITSRRHPPDPAVAATARWNGIAQAVAEWADTQAVALRDLTVLVPFATLLGDARRAFARRGGWMPRVETTQTLAAGGGPGEAWQPGQLSFDATVDAFGAVALLRSQAWGAAWERRDARGFERAAAMLVQAAQGLARAAHAVPPPSRAAHWAAARERLGGGQGPGATERLLARVALEWAALAPTPATDALFAAVWCGPWVALRAGGPDAATDAWLAGTPGPGLVLDTDAPLEDPFGACALQRPPAWAVCDSFEDEAQCAAAQVLEHVRDGEVPVALIAQDRVLVRRVRALLEREAVRVSDETGWKLSTTRAAALVMALLRAAAPNASTDALFDWLHAGRAAGSGDDPQALWALECACRQGAVTRVAGLRQRSLEPAAALAWARCEEVLRWLGGTGRRTVAGWLDALAQAAQAAGIWAALGADEAGRQVLEALRLTPLPDSAAPPGAAWPAVVAQAALDADGFVDWIDRVLEQSTYVPAASDVAPEVVITPMGRAVLRPFAALVFPGADDRRLGAAPPPHPLLSDAQCEALGLPYAAQLRDHEVLAFVHLLGVSRVTLLRRRADGNDPLGDSVLVERLRTALAAAGRDLVAWVDPRQPTVWPATPVMRSVALPGALLPQRLSASACEALRACPYRFHALHLLRLREDDELDRELQKRDYGNWLHAVLHRFHRDRPSDQGEAEEVDRLRAIGRDVALERCVDEAQLVPYGASFAALAPRYVAWLRERDRQGARWLRGEDPVRARPAALDGVELYGVIDRVDAWSAAGGGHLELIDYKTGSAQALRERVREPLEDTQLAFYAALMAAGSSQPLTAAYLALDGTQRVETIEHEGVLASAQALVEGLGEDLRRLRAGAGLAALGEGATCEYCAARGVCRRDDWSPVDADEAAS